MKNFLSNLNKYLFYIFIFLLPWQTIWIIREVFYGTEKWHYGTIGLYVSDIILIIWILLSIYLYKKILLESIIQKKYLLISALLLSVWCFLSSLWALDFSVSFYFSIKLFFALTLFFFVQILPINIQKVGFIFLSSVFIQSIIGFILFVSQQSISQKFLGLIHYETWQGGSAIINTGAERWLRDYGVMPHPNIFGGLLVLSLLLCIALYLKTSKKSYSTQFFLLISIALFTFNLSVTFSRTSWIAFFIGFLALLLIIFKSKKYSLNQLIAPTLIVFAIIIMSITLLQPLFFTRVTQDSKKTHNSISDRSIYLQDAKYLITSKPIVGAGVANYTNTAFAKISTRSAIWQYQPVHNVYILIIAEIGLIGLLLFFMFLFFYFKNVYTNKTYLTIIQKVFVLFSILILLIALFDHWAWTSHFGLFLFFLITGLTLNQKNIKDYNVNTSSQIE